MRTIFLHSCSVVVLNVVQIALSLLCDFYRVLICDFPTRVLIVGQQCCYLLATRSISRSFDQFFLISYLKWDWFGGILEVIEASRYILSVACLGF